MNAIDQGWLDSLLRFMGDGSPHQPIPIYKKADGTIDPIETLDRAFLMYNIKPKGASNQSS